MSTMTDTDEYAAFRERQALTSVFCPRHGTRMDDIGPHDPYGRRARCNECPDNDWGVLVIGGEVADTDVIKRE